MRRRRGPLQVGDRRRQRGVRRRRESDGAVWLAQPVVVASVNDDDGDEVGAQPGKMASTCQTTLDPDSGMMTRGRAVGGGGILNRAAVDGEPEAIADGLRDRVQEKVDRRIRRLHSAMGR